MRRSRCKGCGCDDEPYVKVSELRYRGTFQSKSGQTSDGRGGFKGAYVDFVTRWMKLEAKTKNIDRERVKEQQQQTSMTYLVTIRYHNGISADMRIKVDNKLLYIVKNPYDPENGKRRWLTMECEERRE